MNEFPERFFQGPLTENASRFTYCMVNIENARPGHEFPYDDDYSEEAYVNWLRERAGSHYASLTESDKMFVPAEYLLAMLTFN